MLGEILVTHGTVSQRDLDNALAEQRRRATAGSPVRLGELLIELGLVSRDQLERALAERQSAVTT